MADSRSRFSIVRFGALCTVIALLTNCNGQNGTTPPVSNPAKSPVREHHPEMIPADGVVSPTLMQRATVQRGADRERKAGRVRNAAFVGMAPAGRMYRTHLIGKTRPMASLGTASTLVLFDTAGTWGYLGELYAMAVANLAGHFGTVATEPIGSYTSGQLNQYTATIYVGSTYYGSASSIPSAFYSDAFATANPLIWIDDNIWYFADTVGPAAFETKYGWDPTNSYFANSSGTTGNVTQVSYKSQTLTRTIPAGADGGVLHPYILGGTYPAVTTLATAVDTSTSPSTSFPWAIQSGNLTYIGEIPFDYVTVTDRVLVFEDLLFSALAPATATRHRAMVRLEDLNPSDDPSQDMAAARYLYSQNVPFAFGVIGEYTDPDGYYNGGVAQTLTWSQEPTVANAITYMASHGGTMVSHGFTHQYSNVNNPYDGVTGDDAEFFLASVNSANSVVWNGPIPGDSTSWAAGRAASAISQYAAGGLPQPGIWETPHYFGTDLDYAGFAQYYPERYERSLYFNGTLVGGSVNYNSYIGQFFPYPVIDVYGTKVLPEDLGNYEPVPFNNNPAWLPANIIGAAQDNLVVRDGFASFFYHPYYGTSALRQTVTGIKALGYTFVAPSSL
ncbi:MAG: DUF2334 domain-containing protein [Candidatus Eremiobacteraeota bacterium]|nr:DUF2334 domain-containing protein [Candidatus Eremiobacteraeota bacterium]